MRKVFLVFAALLIVFTTAEARRKKEMAGAVDNLTYTDNAYGFQLKLTDDWNARVRYAEDNVRLVMTQKNYGVPSRYSSAQDYTWIPRIVVFADTSSMSPNVFLDSLLSQSYNSKQKKEILKEFDFLQQNGAVPKDKRAVTIGGQTGVMWIGSAKYTKDIPASPSSPAVTRVDGSYGGLIVAVRKDRTIVLFHLMCEQEFFDAVSKATTDIVNSLTWTAPTN